MPSKKLTNKTNSAIFILIILGFIAVANYLFSKKFVRLDLTENKMYSISGASKNLLKNLDDIVNINVYFSKNLPPQAQSLESDVKDVLTEFKAYAGKNLHITWTDPAESEETKRKVRSLGIPEIQMQTYEKDKAAVIQGFIGLAVLYADKKEIIPVIQNMSTFEYDLAQCIMKVFRSEAPKVAVLKTDTLPYFDERMRMQMRGQLPPDPTEEAYKPVYEQLKGNYAVSTIDISDGKPIDPSYKTLIVPGGDESSFTERDIFEIDQYFMNGGNLIILADAVKIDLQRGADAIPQNPRIFKLLEKYGVRVDQSLVLDASCGQVQIPQQVGPFTMNVPINYPYIVKITPEGLNNDNPAVSGLGQMILPWPSPLTVLVDMADSAASDMKNSGNVQATVLIQSSPKSWVETGNFNLNPQQKWSEVFAEKQSELKPHILSVYLTGSFNSYFAGKSVPSKTASAEETGDSMSQIQLQTDNEDKDRTIIPSNTGRHLVVIGDSDFLKDQNAAPGNVAWILNVVDWLTLDENLISIRSRTLIDRTIKNDKLAAGNSYANTIRFINILLMPFLLIMVGLFIFFKRREVIDNTPSPVKKEGNA